MCNKTEHSISGDMKGWSEVHCHEVEGYEYRLCSDGDDNCDCSIGGGVQ